DGVGHRTLERLESQALAFVQRILFADVRCQCGHTLLRLLYRDAGLQAAERSEIVGVADRSFFLTQGEWLPHIDWAPKHRVIETGRHHADDLDGLAVELNLASDDVWVAAEASCPETIGQDDYVVTAGLKLFGLEDAAVRRRHAEQRKEIGGGGETEQTFRRLALFGQVSAGVR